MIIIVFERVQSAILWLQVQMFVDVKIVWV